MRVDLSVSLFSSLSLSLSLCMHLLPSQTRGSVGSWQQSVSGSFSGMSVRMRMRTRHCDAHTYTYALSKLGADLEAFHALIRHFDAIAHIESRQRVEAASNNLRGLNHQY